MDYEIQCRFVVCQLPKLLSNDCIMSQKSVISTTWANTWGNKNNGKKKQSSHSNKKWRQNETKLAASEKRWHDIITKTHVKSIGCMKVYDDNQDITNNNKEIQNSHRLRCKMTTKQWKSKRKNTRHNPELQRHVMIVQIQKNQKEAYKNSKNIYLTTMEILKRLWKHISTSLKLNTTIKLQWDTNLIERHEKTTWSQSNYNQTKLLKDHIQLTALLWCGAGGWSIIW